ncbi:MAG: CrcB family protein [Sphingomonadaceae bacterium]|nr:CrcB family protein [Sphingomonadaceae bacterium]
MAHPSFLAASLFVALGGGIGAWLRFLTGRIFTAWLGPVRASEFPWATLTVNVLGSLAMGLLVGWLARHSTGSGLSSEGARLFMAIGLLGGFTTFSSFSLEMVLLAERGQIGLAALYAGTSILAGVAGLFAGLAIMRSVG